MSYIEGTQLGEIWDNLTEDEKRSYALQLRGILEKMRVVPPPADGLIGTCDGKEVRNPNPLNTYTGPACHSRKEFHDYLMKTFCEHTPKAVTTAMARRLAMQKEHRVVLTHTDLAPRNIIVRDGSIVGLIDWEDGGWYPEYWEYVKFFQRKGSMDRDFVRFSEDIFPCEYPDELVDSIALSKYQ